MSHTGSVYKWKLVHSKIVMQKFMIIHYVFLNKSFTALPLRLIHWVFQRPVLRVTILYVSLSQYDKLLLCDRYNITELMHPGKLRTTWLRGITWWPGHSPKPSHLLQFNVQNTDSLRRSDMHSKWNLILSSIYIFYQDAHNYNFSNFHNM